MKKVFITCAALGAVLFMESCQQDQKEKETGDQQTQEVKEEKDTEKEKPASDVVTMENNGVKLVEVTGSPEFPNSKLTVSQPKSGAKLSPGTADFKFEIMGGDYKLMTQTEDEKAQKCANSQKGQHIHLILDNNPYEAAYNKEYTTSAELTPGNHVALAFLSRSYHESLKHDGAASVVQFQVGDKKEDQIDLEAPHMFYSRPKGEYSLSDASKVFVDFYLLNTTLGEDGNYVECTINDKASFKITKWAPFYMEGLPLGKNTIKLKLMDADGNYVEGPFNTVEREFTLLK